MAAGNLQEAEDLQTWDHRIVLHPLREELKTNQSRETPRTRHVEQRKETAAEVETMEVVVVVAVTETQMAEEAATEAAAAEEAVTLRILLTPWQRQWHDYWLSKRKPNTRRKSSSVRPCRKVRRELEPGKTQ